MTDGIVTILMPALNEAGYIEAAIASILPGTEGPACELIVLDGGSTDATREIVTRLAQADPRLKLADNMGRIQSAAMNLGARIAHPDARVLVRADCHAVYPPGFVAVCVAKLAEKAAVSVVVTMRTEGVRAFQKGVAAAQNSLLGNGGSAHRRPGESRYIDHGHHAAFDRAAFLAAGGYDETLAANEDVELDARLSAAGGRIWLETSIPVVYFPRAEHAGLARQYFKYGRGRAVSWLRHRYALKLRQLAPLGVTLANAGAVLLALCGFWPFWLVPAVYILLCIAWGVATSVRQAQWQVAWSMAPACMIMHHAWGAGFLAGMLAARPRWGAL